MDGKSTYKLGQMVIDPKQVFWKRQYVFVCIPFVQLLKGHVIISTRRNILNYKDLDTNQLFDIALTTKFVAKSLESYFGCSSSTIHIQNSPKEGGVGQLMIHIFPRKAGDFKKNQQIYELLDKYPADLTKYYNQKIASYGNAFVGKILEAINEERLKFQQFLNNAYKDEQSF